MLDSVQQVGNVSLCDVQHPIAFFVTPPCVFPPRQVCIRSTRGIDGAYPFAKAPLNDNTTCAAGSVDYAIYCKPPMYDSNANECRGAGFPGTGNTVPGWGSLPCVRNCSAGLYVYVVSCGGSVQDCQEVVGLWCVEPLSIHTCIHWLSPHYNTQDMHTFGNIR